MLGSKDMQYDRRQQMAQGFTIWQNVTITKCCVERGASDKDIKKAYCRMAMKHYPDRNPDDKNAEESFKEINEAFEILSDKQKKAAYDQYGHAGADPSMGGEPVALVLALQR